MPTHSITRRPVVTVLLALLLFAAAALAPAGEAGADAASARAKQILADAGVRDGLVVHLGCGDGRLTAALGAGGAVVVHGLAPDAGDVAAARRQIRDCGLYGRVSVEEFDDRRLPYADNLVNLLLADALGDVPREEVLRVLAPGGTALVGDERIVKPPRAGTDEWTHYLHDASGNAVAHDDVVGPPRRVQWVAPPRHTRSHEHIPSINALVTSSGRLFYIADEGPIALVQKPAKWHLVARDAYNGLALWKRPFDPWFPHIVNWGRTPRHLQRRLVADGDRVFVTLGLHAPVSLVEARTGKTLKAYDGTAGTEEIVYHEGVLLLVVREVTDDREAELARWRRLQQEPESPVYERDAAEPLVNRLRKVERRADQTILALDAGTGRALWRKDGKDASGLRRDSLSALGDRVFYQKGGEVRCVNLQTGRERWTASTGPLRVVYGNTVVCGGKVLRALEAETGKMRWKQDSLLSNVRDVFIAGGSLWIGGFKPWAPANKKYHGPSWGPYFAVQRDLATGKVLREVKPENPGHHHRCWRNKATDRYLLAGRRGVEFIDLATGDLRWHNWVRGVCRYGVMPANGLLYAPPHACGCYITAKLDGFFALAPAAEASFRGGTKEAVSARHRTSVVEKGPAYDGPIRNPKSELGNRPDWPTYRHDAARSGCTPAAVPADLRPAWTAEVGGRLTAPTVAGGKVFVASVDAHRLVALDAGTGRPAWDVTAGGRIDTPPTLAGGRAVFGCRDGYVYSVRASDGVLAWRLRAARKERRIAVRGQLESAWPVPGSVLVKDGTAYVAAGRSSYLDGGIDLCGIETETGAVRSRRTIYSPDPKTGRQPDQFGPNRMPGVLGEILTADKAHIYLRDMVFDARCRPQEKGAPHLLTLTGFRDETFAHRSYWIFGTHTSLSTGCSGQERGLLYGRLLVFDGSTVYGYGRAKVHWSNMLQDGAYRLFARDPDAREARWTARVPVRVRALVKAGGVLFAAGPPAADADGSDAGGETPAGLLLALAAADGSELARCPLAGEPVFDGLAAAAGRLYLATTDGTVLCLAGK
ncbi:MAG: PQQ-binding-like beta-propeller repeat protein [Phycisphaerae bacterium]